MTTLHKAAQAALEALGLPCDRWNATQYEAVKKARDDLLAALAKEPAVQEPAYYRERLKDWTCRKVENAGGTPGHTLYYTKLGARPELQLYIDEALALWTNIGAAIGDFKSAPQPAVQEPATSFDDPRVQLVYETIIDADDFPPKEDPQQHWDGWIARRIVDKLFAKRLTDEQKRDMVTNYFAEDWAIKAAIGMLDDYEAAVLGEKP